MVTQWLRAGRPRTKTLMNEGVLQEKTATGGRAFRGNPVPARGRRGRVFSLVQSNRQLPVPISRQDTPVRVKLWSLR